MPLPLLGLLFLGAKAVIGKAAIVKTAAVAAKGTAVVAKAAAGHAGLAAKGAVVAVKSYGFVNAVGLATFATLSIGAAALIYERAKRLKATFETGNVTDSLVAAASLMSELKGKGGLEDACSVLDQFIDSSGLSKGSEVSKLTEELLHTLRPRLG